MFPYKCVYRTMISNAPFFWWRHRLWNHVFSLFIYRAKVSIIILRLLRFFSSFFLFSFLHCCFYFIYILKVFYSFYHGNYELLLSVWYIFSFVPHRRLSIYMFMNATCNIREAEKLVYILNFLDVFRIDDTVSNFYFLHFYVPLEWTMTSLELCVSLNCTSYSTHAFVNGKFLKYNYTFRSWQHSSYSSLILSQPQHTLELWWQTAPCTNLFNPSLR
jgi:hypothetical protein